MFNILSLKEPPERLGDPEFPFPTREAYHDWIRRKAISNVWHGAEEAERRLTEKYGPGLVGSEEDRSTDE